MRAAQIATLDGPAAISVVDVPEPDADGKVLIDVHAAGVTFPEVLLSRGQYQLKPPLPFVPGSEVAGTVRSAPEGSGLRAGQRVAAFPGFGGFAEVAAADPGFVFPLPDGVSFEQGAALPMNYLTMHFALARRGRLQAGETVLVHGAAGGLGTAGIQLAKAYGARVLAVVSSEAKGAPARAAGADETGSRSSPAAAAWTSSPIRWAATASPTRCAASPARGGCWCWASPAGRSPRSGSTGCCSTGWGGCKAAPLRSANSFRG